MVVDIEGLLPRVSRPARYSGGEWNSVVKEWAGAALRFVLAYPDVYEIGVGSLGLNVLYDILNRIGDVLCERCYLPWPDLEAEMEKDGLPLWSLETRHPLADFDVVLFYLDSPLQFSGLLRMLNLAGLPPRSDQRQGGPLVVGAGPAALNPEPLADFVDLFILGDSEAVIGDIVNRLRQRKHRPRGKGPAIGRELAGLVGVYIPAFYRVNYREDGTIDVVETKGAAAPSRPRARWAESLGPPLRKPIVPFVEAAWEGATLEMVRGSAADEAFSLTGSEWADARRGPRRERTLEEIVQGAKELLLNTGYRKLALTDGDHSRIEEVARRLRQELDEEITIWLPPLRPVVASVEIADLLGGGQRRQSISFALAGASERLRATSGQPLRDAEALATAELAFARGWPSLRLYLPIGLPQETRKDVLAAAALAAGIKERGRSHFGGRTRVRLQVAVFVPRAWTPYQWASQGSEEELGAKLEAMRKACRRAGVEFFGQGPKRAILEGMLARGDRRLGPALLRAGELGARPAGERGPFAWAGWEQALKEQNLKAAFYVQRERYPEEKFPWSHLEVGVEENQLRQEWRRIKGGSQEHVEFPN